MVPPHPGPAASPRKAASGADSPAGFGSPAAIGSPTAGGGGGVAGFGSDLVPELLKPLGSPDQHVRQAACQALAKAECHFDPRVVGALMARLQQDRDIYVRQAAASALGQAARKGDESALAVLLQRSATDTDPGVRRLASGALGQLALRGSTAVISTLLGRLEDKDGGVRRSALLSLAKVAEKGDAQVIPAVFGRTSDGEAFVRHTAVEVLSKLAEEGNREVVNRFLELLGADRDGRVRWSATEGLGRMATRGDSRVLSGLLARLDDDSDSVRRAAAAALGRVTFAPLQELELQERHIAELEHAARHEVNTLHMAIRRQKESHVEEVAMLKKRNEELEEQLKREVSERDARLRLYALEVEEQGRVARVGEFLPHASTVTRFLETLPNLASPECYGTEIIAPVWALRCIRSGTATTPGHGARSTSPPAIDDCASPCAGGKDKRELLALYELFEQLSTGRVSAMELTEAKPLDVYVHRGEDEAWGLYCCSRHRLLALLMRQACARGELIMVRCVIRSKEDCGYWGWHWANFYDGGDGLNVHPSPQRMRPSASGGVTPQGQSTISLAMSGQGTPSASLLQHSGRGAGAGAGGGSGGTTPGRSGSQPARTPRVSRSGRISQGPGPAAAPQGTAVFVPINAADDGGYPSKSP